MYANNYDAYYVQQVAESLPIGPRATAAARGEPGWLSRGLLAANVPDDVKKSDHFLEDLTQRVRTYAMQQQYATL
jgi:hypothetical protein